MVKKIYQENNIDPHDIGTKYKKEDVYEILTVNYLKAQGVIPGGRYQSVDTEAENLPLNI